MHEQSAKGLRYKLTRGDMIFLSCLIDEYKNMQQAAQNLFMVPLFLLFARLSHEIFIYKMSCQETTINITEKPDLLENSIMNKEIEYLVL